jgi:hypothetical protein
MRLCLGRKIEKVEVWVWQEAELQSAEQEDNVAEDKRSSSHLSMPIHSLDVSSISEDADCPHKQFSGKPGLRNLCRNDKAS